jgi:hypothetical protein
MKRSTVLIAILSVLSLAPALQAQRYGYPSQDGYRYPNSGQMDRAAALARELENTATYIYRQYERNNRRPNRAEARVAAGLYELNQQAARLQRQIEGRGYQDGYGYRNDDRYRQDGRYRDGGFARLEEAFFDLSDSLRYVQPRPYVDRGMDQIYGLMNELGRYYGRSGYGKGYQGRDRYGHDRDRYDGYDRDDRPYQN